MNNNDTSLLLRPLPSLQNKQLDVLKHLIALGGLEAEIKATNPPDIERSNFLRYLRRLEDLGYITLNFKEGMTTVRVLHDYNIKSTEIKKVSKEQRRVLEYLCRNYRLNVEISVDLTALVDALNIRTSVVLRAHLAKLMEVGAIDFQRVETQAKIKIFRIPEEFSTPGMTPSKSNPSNDPNNLASRVEELTRLLLRMQTAPIAAYLWRTRFDTAWKEATIHPPSRDDLVNLEFKPVYDWDSIFHGENQEVWVHVKTGGEYVLVGGCQIEKTNEPGYLYRSLDTGIVWCRSVKEFLDGRFMKKSDYIAFKTKETGYV